MEYRVLGPVGIVDGVRDIDVPGRQRALLGLLLIHAPRAVSVEWLADAVWPTDRPENPPNALQGRVSKLRRFVDPDGTGDVLVVRADGYALQVPAETIDATRFEALADHAHDALLEERFTDAVQTARQALALWHGEALEGLAQEPWAVAEAARLQERRTCVFEDLVDAELGRGDAERVIADLESHVRRHPLRERARAQLMIALDRSGRQAEALEVYRHGHRMLRDELGIEPGRRLQQVERAILEQSEVLGRDTSADAVSRTLARPVAPVAVETPRAVSTGDDGADLVGRQRELATIETAVSEVLSGHGRLVVITGEAGIGKSELVHAARRHAVSHGVGVQVARCAEPGSTPAYWPWLQVLRGLADDLDTASLVRALGPGAADVAELVPEVRARLPEVAPLTSGDPVLARARLADAVVQFLRRAASERPLLIAVEDVHLAGAPSLEVLDLLVSTVPATSMFLLVTYRPTEVATDTDRGRLLDRLSASATACRLPLTGLSERDVAALAANRTGRALEAAVPRLVHGRTDGNPLFVTELLKLLEDGPGQVDRRALRTDLPAGIRDVIQARLRRLPDSTRGMLQGAAILGRTFEIDVVASMLDLPLGVVADDVDVAVRSGVVEVAEDGLGVLRFVHALVRDTVEAELAPVRRARLHGAAADALALRGGRRSVEVAFHLIQAVPMVDTGRTVAAALTAADEAAGVFAYEQAETLLVRALAVLDRYGDDRAPEITLQSRLVSLYSKTDGFTSPRVRTATGRIRELAGRLTDAPEVVATLWSQWAYWANRARIDLAREFAADLVTDASETDDAAARMAAEFAVGQTAFLAGDPQGAAEHLQHAGRLVQDLDEAEISQRGLQLVALNCRCALSHGLLLAGREREAADLIHRAVDRADATGGRYARAHTRMFMGWYEAARGDAEQTLAWSRDARQRCEEHGFALIAALAGAFEGWATAVSGDPVAGIALLRTHMDALYRADFGMLRPWHLDLLADSLLAAGRTDEALAIVDDAIATARRTGIVFHLSEHLRRRAEVLDALGERADARQAIAEAMDVADRQRCPTLRRRLDDHPG